MKKSKLKKLLHKAVEDEAFEKLQQQKGGHSKVKKLNHSKLKMQKYLKANKNDIKVEEAQIIFKMRSRMTDVKVNFRNKNETLECDVCKDEEETQKHVLECKEIMKNKNKILMQPEYEEIFQDNVKNQIEIAKIFIENMKIRKQITEIT